MKYPIAYSGVIVLASWLLLSGCSSDQQSASRTPVAYFNIVDSIDLNVNDDFIAVLDYFNGYYLGVNSSREEIHLFDRTGKKIKVINIQGPGPNEYGSLVKCGFISDAQIGIIDQRKFLIYDIISENISTCPYKEEKMLPLPSDMRAFSIPGNRLITSSSLFEISPSEKRYFDEIHTFSVLGEGCKIENYGEFPPESIYRKKLFPAFFDPLVYVSNPLKNEILQIFPMDQNIYVFSGENFKLTKTIPIHSDKFGEIVHRGDDSMEAMTFLLQKNSLFRNIIANEELIVLQYLQGLSDDKIVPSLASYNKKIGAKRKKFYSVFDKNGKQLGYDFEDERVLALIGFDEEGHLLVKANDENERNIILKIDVLFQ